MTALGRAFVAIVPPDSVLDAVELAIAPLRDEPPREEPPRDKPLLRWAPRAQWHLTLQFLGAVPDPDALAGQLRLALDGVDAPALALGGLGAFGPAGRATVLWVGLREGRDPLVDLAARVATAAAGAGLALEERPYRPHLTVARAVSALDLRVPIAAASPTIVPSWLADEVVLFESILGRGGTSHLPRARFVLRS